MNYKKYATIILSALCLTACGNTSAVSEETITSVSETTAETSETTAAETAEETAENSTEPSSDGYRYEKYDLYIDMSKVKDAGALYDKLISEGTYISDLILSNVDDADLSFIRDRDIYSLTIEKYNGRTDLGVLAGGNIRELTFGEITDSTGLDAIAKADMIYTLIFDTYSGNIDFGFASDCKDLQGINFGNVTDVSGLETLAKVPNLNFIVFEKYSRDIDLNFLSECPNITGARLEGADITADMFADAVKNSSLKTLYIKTENFDLADGEEMMLALPDVNVTYCMDDSPWYKAGPWEEGYVPESDVMVYTNPCVNCGASEEKWECRTSDAGFDRPDDEFKHQSTLLCVFTNYSDETKTVDSARLYRIYNGEEPVAFSGGEMLEIGLELAPQTKVDLDITNDMLLYSALESGDYRIVFNVGNEQLEHRFCILSDEEKSPYFLTDEQTEIYKKAESLTNTYFGCSHYLSEEDIQNTTAEEFIAMVCEGFTYDEAVSLSFPYMDENGELKAICADRGGDISAFDHFYKCLYSGEDTVIFQSIVVHTTEDNPYFLWFEAIDYKMVNTDDGWRFERFPLWY